MAHEPISDDDLRKYLLDEMSRSDRKELEDLYLVDDLLYERLLVIEEELIDQHLYGLLSPTQSNYLKKSLLLSRDGAERLAFAETLAQFRKRQKQNYLSRFIAILRLRSQWRMLVSATAGIAILFIVFAVRWRGFHAEKVQVGPFKNENEHIARSVPAPVLPQHELSTTEKLQPKLQESLPFLTLLLRSVHRDASTPNVLNIPEGRYRVQLRAEIPDEGQPGQVYRATVKRVENGPEQASTGTTSQKTRSGIRLVSANFNSELFQDGDYILTIVKSGVEIGAYSFSVIHNSLPPR